MPSWRTRSWKAAIQVLGVAVVGGVVAFAVSALQRERVERYEELRRDADRLLEDRRREDDFLRHVHDESISSYNEVKKTRRMSTGALKRVEGRLVLPSGVYEARIAEINEQQLAFERMAPQVPLMGAVDVHNRTDSHGRSQSHFRVAEVYLNEVLHEYQERGRREGSIEEDLDLHRELPQFARFLFDVQRSKERLSAPIGAITSALEARISRPVDLPSPMLCHVHRDRGGACESPQKGRAEVALPIGVVPVDEQRCPAPPQA